MKRPYVGGRYGHRVQIGVAEAALLFHPSEISSLIATFVSPTRLFPALVLIDMRGRSGLTFWDCFPRILLGGPLEDHVPLPRRHVETPR